MEPRPERKGQLREDDRELDAYQHEIRARESILTPATLASDNGKERFSYAMFIVFRSAETALIKYSLCLFIDQ